MNIVDLDEDEDYEYEYEEWSTRTKAMKVIDLNEEDMALLNGDLVLKPLTIKRQLKTCWNSCPPTTETFSFATMATKSVYLYTSILLNTILYCNLNFSFFFFHF